MTSSVPVVLLTKRTGNSSDRPEPATVQVGELAISFGSSDPGLYFKDSTNAIRKVSGCNYVGAAPNSAAQGEPGNSVGELWADTTAATYLRVWTGVGWEKVGAGFADVADLANTATVATNALNCTGKIATTFTGALPAVGVAGSAAFNTATGIFYMSDGTSWVQIN